MAVKRNFANHDISLFLEIIQYMTYLSFMMKTMNPENLKIIFVTTIKSQFGKSQRENMEKNNTNGLQAAWIKLKH